MAGLYVLGRRAIVGADIRSQPDSGRGGNPVLAIALLVAAVAVGGGLWYAKIWIAGKALKASGVIK